MNEAQSRFQFYQDGPLIMRMNPDEGQSAATVGSRGRRSRKLLDGPSTVNGEERFSVAWRRAIVEYRKEHPLTTTLQFS